MWREADRAGAAVRRLGRRAAKPDKPIRARPVTCWDDVLTTPVEVMTPDRTSARALLDEAQGHFRAELVETDGATVVRMRPALTAPAGWVFELLALVERWLDAHNLQVAHLHHGSRSYVITAAAPGSRPDGGPEPAAAG